MNADEGRYIDSELPGFLNTRHQIIKGPEFSVRQWQGGVLHGKPEI
jgi:hypothetical protein